MRCLAAFRLICGFIYLSCQISHLMEWPLVERSLVEWSLVERPCPSEVSPATQESSAPALLNPLSAVFTPSIMYGRSLAAQSSADSAASQLGSATICGRIVGKELTAAEEWWGDRGKHTDTCIEDERMRQDRTRQMRVRTSPERQPQHRFMTIYGKPTHGEMTEGERARCVPGEMRRIICWPMTLIE